MYIRRCQSLVLAYILLSSMLFSCNISLFENEAQTLIEKKLELPKKTWLEFKIWPFDLFTSDVSDAASGVQELIGDDYLAPTSKSKSVTSLSWSQRYSDGRDLAKVVPYQSYAPTDKGKLNLGSLTLGSLTDSNLHIKAAIFTEMFNSIDEILIDYDNKTARVTFTTRFEPIEPYHSALHRKGASQYFPSQFFDPYVHFTPGKEYLQEALFKRYDQGGWRIEELSDVETERQNCAVCNASIPEKKLGT